MQTLVVLSHTVCTHVIGPKNLGDAGTRPRYDVGVADTLETRYCVIVPNFVAGQTISP